jgi:CheY-like chemotaxis protein
MKPTEVAPEEELEHARAALFQAQKLQALGELTGGIAHDFNNLMTVIRGAADMLGRPELKPERRERYLQAITDTADRATTLVSHLLTFGRRQPLRPEVLDLNHRIEEVADLLDRTLGETITVELDLAPDLWRAQLDAAQLETALLNAAFNARDAMPDGGTIRIATVNVPAAGTDPDMVRVAVSDTGVGMTADIVRRVFEPFFTSKPVGKGTGLGLSQVHGFAAQAGGRADIVSAPGRGTTLSLFLPRTQKLPRVEDCTATAPESYASLRVLLVEDSLPVREIAASMLEDMGHEVIAASSAEEAIALMGGESVDLLMTDVVMPGRSGISLARWARKRHPFLPVVLASGYSEEIINGVAAEFELLRKPFNGKSMAAAISAACAGMERKRHRAAPITLGDVADRAVAQGAK